MLCSSQVFSKDASVEVIVVENGSSDATSDVVREFQAEHAYVKLIEDVPRGKGVAVRVFVPHYKNAAGVFDPGCLTLIFVDDFLQFATGGENMASTSSR